LWKYVYDTYKASKRLRIVKNGLVTGTPLSITKNIPIVAQIHRNDGDSCSLRTIAKRNPSEYRLLLRIQGVICSSNLVIRHFQEL